MQTVAQQGRVRGVCAECPALPSAKSATSKAPGGKMVGELKDKQCEKVYECLGEIVP